MSSKCNSQKRVLERKLTFSENSSSYYPVPKQNQSFRNYFEYPEKQEELENQLSLEKIVSEFDGQENGEDYGDDNQSIKQQVTQYTVPPQDVDQKLEEYSDILLIFVQLYLLWLLRSLSEYFVEQKTMTLSYVLQNQVKITDDLFSVNINEKRDIAKFIKEVCDRFMGDYKNKSPKVFQIIKSLIPIHSKCLSREIGWMDLVNLDNNKFLKTKNTDSDQQRLKAKWNKYIYDRIYGALIFLKSEFLLNLMEIHLYLIEKYQHMQKRYFITSGFILDSNQKVSLKSRNLNLSVNQKIFFIALNKPSFIWQENSEILKFAYDQALQQFVESIKTHSDQIQELFAELRKNKEQFINYLKLQLKQVEDVIITSEPINCEKNETQVKEQRSKENQELKHKIEEKLKQYIKKEKQQTEQKSSSVEKRSLKKVKLLN